MYYLYKKSYFFCYNCGLSKRNFDSDAHNNGELLCQAVQLKRY